MVAPVVTGAEKGSSGGTTISCAALSGMQDGDRIIWIWRTTADVTSPTTLEGWTLKTIGSGRFGVVVSPPLTVADGPWDVLTHSGAPGTRNQRFSYTPGDGDPDPIIGDISSVAGVMPGIVVPVNDSIVIGVGSTASSNTDWTKPSELTNDNGIYQPGFSNPIGGAYEEGVSAQTLSDLSYSFSSDSSPRHGVLVVIPGSAAPVTHERTVGDGAINLQTSNTRTVADGAINLLTSNERTVADGAINLSAAGSRSITGGAINLAVEGIERTIEGGRLNVSRQFDRTITNGSIDLAIPSVRGGYVPTGFARVRK